MVAEVEETMVVAKAMVQMQGWKKLQGVVAQIAEMKASLGVSVISHPRSSTAF